MRDLWHQWGKMADISGNFGVFLLGVAAICCFGAGHQEQALHQEKQDDASLV